jgi:hypothetical protein
MRVAVWIAGVTGVLVSSAAIAGSAVIPQEFRGEWREDPANCGKYRDESYLEVGRKTVSYYESSGPVQAAVARGRELALILILSGEGETWLATEFFEIAPDGSWLMTEGTPEGYKRYRCPTEQERPNNSSKPTPRRGAA